MKPAKSHIRKKIRAALLQASLLPCLLYGNSAYAQTSSCPDQTGEYHCTLFASTSYTSNQIYDDRPNVNFEPSGFSNGDISDCEPWNCGNHFLLTGYVDSVVSLSFNFNSTYAPAPTIVSHNIIIKNLTRGTTFLNTFVTGYSLYGPQLDLGGYLFTSSVPGEYQIQYYRVTTTGFIATPGVDSADITGRVVLQPKIQQLWITAPPICAGFTGNYNFQLHSIPPLDSIIIPSLPWTTSDCASINPENSLNFNFAGSTDSIYRYWAYNPGYTPYSSRVPGNGWYVNLEILSTDIDNNLDINDYYIDSTDIAPYVTGSVGITNPVINLQFYDGIATTLYATADLVIEYPAIPAASYVGTITATNAGGPPYATGIPWPSYDVFDYHVTGTETWTPTNNPIVNFAGGKWQASNQLITHKTYIA